MIITRAPLRISFCGGGTDVPGFYHQETGKVISMTINKYVYVFVNRPQDNVFRIKYKQVEEHGNVSEIAHPIVRETLLKYHWNTRHFLDIATMSDISGGTGLGSSSAFTVALCRAIKAVNSDAQPRRSDIAEDAFEIERERLSGSLGKQDHYASAFGGLNVFYFSNPSGFVYSDRLTIPQEHADEFCDTLALYKIGDSRVADEILKDQEKNFEESPKVLDAGRQMTTLVEKFASSLLGRRYQHCGSLLNESWHLKKQFSEKISNPVIDGLYSRCLDAGAWGGKLLGAGTSGFLLIMRPPKISQEIDAIMTPFSQVLVEMERFGVTTLSQKPLTPGSRIESLWIPDTSYD